MTDQSLASEVPSINLAGSPWLPTLSPWDEAQVGHLFQVFNGSTPKSSVEEYWGGDVSWATPVDVQEVGDKWLRSTNRSITEKGYENCGTNLVPRGSVILTTRAPIGKLAVAATDMCTNQGCKSLVPEQGVNSKFYFYALSAARQYLEILGEGATFSELGTDELKRLRLPHPSEDEQDQITTFLDRRTARIDGLVTKQKRLLKFLEEKRQAVLDRLLEQAETEGHARLKYLVDFLPGFAFSSDDFSTNLDDVRLLRGINVGVGKIDWDDVEYWPSDNVRDYERYLLEPGDIVLGMDRPWISDGIRIAQMSESDCPALLVQRVLRIRAGSEVHQKYVRMVLESERFRQYFEPITTGVSVPHISQKQVGEFRIPLPSKSHQASILSQWETFQDEKRRLERTIKKSLDLLTEKRQALITAAVTGQIDVAEERGETHATQR